MLAPASQTRKLVGDYDSQSGDDAMRGYVISPEAVQDLRDIRAFIALDNPNAAERVIDQLFAAFAGLVEFPQKGHIRRDLTSRNVRFWAVGNYLVVYRSMRNSLQIVAILQGARDIPRVLNER